ncbi:Hypothetical predicted protein [Cloeon dipterum]|uniref:Uncharacterized protein n=1 Tax=Cloeon dipterum TaxID=197152 RepID=A0A8S1CZR3_9INSE|nr:Hypothetical predicted protein [Cloeon dipterum]
MTALSQSQLVNRAAVTDIPPLILSAFQKMEDCYVSCIKINGRPILPPILDEEEREMLRSYRELALQIEFKVKDRKKETEIQILQAQSKKNETDLPQSQMSPVPTESTELNLDLDSSSEATMFSSTPGHRLIRSDSYTLENPSQALLDSFAESEISETPSLTDKRPKSALPKYSCGRKKTAKVATIVSPKKKKLRQRREVWKETESVDSEETVIEVDYMNNLIKSMREEYELKMEQLRQQQEEEKMRIKEEFLSQQHELLRKLNINSPPNRPASPPIKVERSPAVSKSLADLTNRMCQLPLAALVRGYIVRRLHKTERVERIKAQIKDTLFLAINIHEQPQPLSPADIMLHGRLIQQLDQSLNELHTLFFENSLADRLKVIATDRERMLKGPLSNRSSNEKMVSTATERRRRNQQGQQENFTPKFGKSVHNKSDELKSSKRSTVGSGRHILAESGGLEGGNVRHKKQNYSPWR